MNKNTALLLKILVACLWGFIPVMTGFVLANPFGAALAFLLFFSMTYPALTFIDYFEKIEKSN
jgi:hypothetical protein